MEAVDQGGFRRVGPVDRLMIQAVVILGVVHVHHILVCAAFIGVGSAVLSSEESVYRYKALQSVKIESLPQDAAAFRGWKNGLVTKLCSIDITGSDIILHWILEALDPNVDLNVSECMFLPRLDAYLAALLTEPKHLKGDLGVQFQAYVEQCQQNRISPGDCFGPCPKSFFDTKHPTSALQIF